MKNEILPQGKTICVECGDMWRIEDTCKIDGLCFYCCKHEPFPDGPRKPDLVQ